RRSAPTVAVTRTLVAQWGAPSRDALGDHLGIPQRSHDRIVHLGGATPYDGLNLFGGSEEKVNDRNGVDPQIKKRPAIVRQKQTIVTALTLAKSQIGSYKARLRNFTRPNKFYSAHDGQKATRAQRV